MKNKLLNIIIIISFLISAVFACTGNCYEPIANSGENSIYYQGSTVSLDGSSSYDPDDSDVSLDYSWTVPNGIELINSDSPMPSFVSLSFNSFDFVKDGCSANTDDVEYLTFEDCMDNNGIWVDLDGSISQDCTDGLSNDEQACCEDNSGSWIVGNCPLNPSFTEEECCINDGGNWDELSGECSNVTGYACSDGYSLNEEDCCDNNGGEWDAFDECLDNQDCDGQCEGSPTASWDPVNQDPSWVSDSGNTCVGSLESWSEIFTENDIAYIPVSLIVNDGDYDSDLSQTIVTVVFDNTSPVLDIELTYNITKLSEFTIDASAASDNASLTDTLYWSWGNYPEGFTEVSNEPSSVLTLASPDEGGTYNLTLTVSDGVVADDLNLNFTINVLENQVPYAVPGDDISIGISEIFTLSGSESYDPDGSGSLAYLWNVDDCINNGFLSLNDETSENINLEAPAVSDITCSAFLTVTDGENGISSTWSGEDLFISEIAEAGSSSNSYIELYNGTSSLIDLTSYSVVIVRNNGQEYVIDLSGQSITSGSTFLIVRNDGSDVLELLDNPNFIEFNNINKMTGDDAVELYKDGELIDTFGDRGNLVKWDIAGVEDASQNHTLVRKNFVLSGNIDWSQSAGASDADASEWIVYDRDVFDYGGTHFNTYCDNFVNITTVENLAPLTRITSSIDEAVIDLVPSATLTLVGSIIDPEGNIGDAGWIPDVYSADFVDIDIDDYSVTDGVCMNGNLYEGIGCNNNNDCGAGYSCNEDNDVYEVSFETVFVLSDQFDHTQNLSLTWAVYDGTNDTVFTAIEFDVAESNEAPIINYQVTETCGNSTQAIFPIDGVYQSYEDCEIAIDLSTSTDFTSTGTLLYQWEQLPILDLDNDGSNDLDLSSNSVDGYYNVISTNILTIEIPEHISENKTFDCEVSLSDGELESALVEFDFEIISSMPIVDEILETGLIYEYVENTGYVSQDGFIYEGMIVELDANVFDPDGDDNSLSYSWDADGGASISILGHCDDLAGSIDSVPCNDSLDCQMCSDPQFSTENDCLFDSDGAATGNIWGGGCLDDNSGQLAYLQLPIHIEEDTEFNVELEVEDLDGNESNTIEFSINVLARYPISNAGYDITVVAGEEVELIGYLSQDNQEAEVSLGSWNMNGSGAWEDTGKKIVANYSNSVLTAFDGYVFNWVQTSGDNVALSNSSAVNPTFIAPNSAQEMTFELIVIDPDGFVSEIDEVAVDVVSDYDPLLAAIDGECLNLDGDLIPQYLTASDCLFNSDGAPLDQDDDGVVDYVWNGDGDFRASGGSTIYLNNMQIVDPTFKGTYDFIWESETDGVCSDTDSEVMGCTDNMSLSEVQCCENNGGSWEYPEECNDGIALNPEECCSNNGGLWSGISEFSGICEIGDNEVDFWEPIEGSDPSCIGSLENWEEIQLKLCTSGNYNSICNIDSDCDIVIENADTEDAYFMAPSIDYGEETILSFSMTLTNDTGDGTPYVVSENIDVTIARMSTPVSPTLNAYPQNGQVTLNWNNISELSIDSLTQYADFQGYKLYKSDDYGKTWGDEGDVILSESGDTLGWQPLLIVDYTEDQDIYNCLYNNTDQDCEKTRGLEISGADPYQSWFSFGSNSGLVQSFVDTNVINGIDYVYTITAYDRGLRPSVKNFGSYNDQTGEWEEQPDHNFTEFMAANYYAYNRLDYNIIESYIDEGGIYMYHLQVPDGYPTEFSVIDVQDIWPSTNPDGYYIGIDEDGNKLGYRAFESSKGESIDDHNYVEVTPGYAASNITFPSQNDIDDFLVQDCRAIGNGTKAYEIVDLAQIKNSYVKFEIQAGSGTNCVDGSEDGCIDTFQGYASDDACLYAYRVIPNPDQGPNERLDYIPVSVSGEPGNYEYIPIPYVVLSEDESGSWYLDSNGDGVNNNDEDLSNYEGLPGVDIDMDSYSILIPDYIEGFECFALEYLDDSDYLNNFTSDVDGIRVRFDNAIRNEPSDKFALLHSVTSDDQSLITDVFEDVMLGGNVGLQYYTSFNKKPSFDYEIELSDSYISESVDPGDACPENGSIGAQLPFRVKNLTTGKYVTLKLNDNGIFNGNRPPYYIPPADDPDHDPGAGDCMWQPGELVYFEQDSSFVGAVNNLEFDAQKTYALNFTYSDIHITDRSNLCTDNSSISEWIDVGNYSEGDCVFHEGQMWYATGTTSYQADGLEPNSWSYDDDNDQFLNANPWIPVYPWGAATKITIETQKWYVDGDYWIADMSLLGAGTEVTQEDMDKINVVPNPYIVYSAYNRTPNSLRFTHLPKACSIEVYTVSGELVNVLEHNDLFDGDHFWDLKNKHGRVISPGLYIYIVTEEETGLKFVGKFAVVR